MMACIGQYHLGPEDNVAWLRHLSRDGREYFVFLRAGYPPVVRREKLAPAELVKVYESDPHVRLEEPRANELAVPAGGI